MSMLALSATELVEAQSRGQLSAEEIVSYYLHRARSLNRVVNAVIVFNDDALSQARTLDRRRRAGESREVLGCLCGVPVLVKDNIDVRGLGCAWLDYAGARPAQQRAPTAARDGQAPPDHSLWSATPRPRTRM